MVTSCFKDQGKNTNCPWICNTLCRSNVLLCFEDGICLLTFCGAAMEISTLGGKIIRGLSKQEMNVKQVIRKRWLGMDEVGWKACAK